MNVNEYESSQVSEPEGVSINGWPCYRVTRRGEVFSCQKRGRKNGIGPWRKMKATPCSHGYLTVHLYAGRIRKTCCVHILVLEAFIGPRPNGLQACHNNGIRDDNRIENLRWDTQQANSDDRNKHGNVPRGVISCQSKLTDNAVLQIREKYACGDVTKTKLAAEFGVSDVLIGRIVNFKSWRHITAARNERIDHVSH